MGSPTLGSTRFLARPVNPRKTALFGIAVKEKDWRLWNSQESPHTEG
jgi:hypothetical protein